MSYFSTAMEYHGMWLGVSAETLEKPGLHLVYSAEREKVQTGYGSKFDVYCLTRGQCAVVSYAQNIRERIEHVALDIMRYGSQSIKTALSNEFESVSHGIKFYFNSLPADLNASCAYQLQINGYPLYYDFFKACNPNVNADSWLEDYFRSMVEEGMCWGVRADGRLASVVDLPDTPYMQGIIYELGINTHPSYKQCGYAKLVSGAAIKHALSLGMTPVWSTSEDNTASIKLAQSLGFVKFADVYSVTLV